MAQHDLAFMYYYGKGVPQDDVQAYKWMKLAASGSTGDLKGDCASALDVMKTKMTPEEIARAERLVRMWRPREPASAGGEQGRR